MSHVASFTSLPAELISLIWELVCEDECEGYCRQIWWYRPKTPEYGFKGPSLLAAIHTSAKIRSVMLEHRPYWRLVAEKVLTSSGLRKHDQTKALLKLCALRSGDTLRRLDFERVSNGCPSNLMDFMDVASPSAPHLQRISFPDLPRRYPKPCECSSCRDNGWTEAPNSGVKAMWDSIFNMLRSASSLTHLDLNLPECGIASAKLLEETASLRARPVDLTLRTCTSRRQPASDSLLRFLARLASRTKALCLNIDDIEAPAQLDDLFSSVVKPVSSNLRRLDLSGRSMWEILSTSVMNYDFSQLAHLIICAVDSNGAPSSLPVTPTGRIFNSLTTLESPAWILPRLRAPKVQHLQLILDPSSEGAVADLDFTEWPELEDLVVLLEVNGTISDWSDMVQTILRALTPSETLPCPKLQRIGISDRYVDDAFEWLKKDETDFADYPDDHEQMLWGPVIGFDLYHMDRKRRRVSQEDPRSCSSDTGSKNDDKTRCRPLQTIKVLDCRVDPTAWALIVEDAAGCDDYKRYCYPSPVHVREYLEDCEADEGWKHFASELYRLSAP